MNPQRLYDILKSYEILKFNVSTVYNTLKTIKSVRNIQKIPSRTDNMNYAAHMADIHSDRIK